MLDWYFTQTTHTVWLGTSPQTRAEAFYRKAGWKNNGMHGKGEIKFEMTYKNWINKKTFNLHNHKAYLTPNLNLKHDTGTQHTLEQN